MNRRTILKSILLGPFLFKSRTGLTKTDICNEALSRISETTGTSGEGPYYFKLPEEWDDLVELGRKNNRERANNKNSR